MPKLSTRTGCFNVWIEGPADAPAILLAHGLASSGRTWGLQVPLLASGYRVVRYDARGHGDSDRVTRRLDRQALVNDALAILDRPGIARTAFMGISYGGIVGMHLALDHPERVSRLIICDARPDAPPEFINGWRQRTAEMRTDGRAAVFATGLSGRISEATRRERPDIVAELERDFVATPIETFAAYAEVLEGHDVLRRLSGLAIPTLFVVGEHDRGVPLDLMQEMAAMVPNAQLKVIPGAAHLSNLDRPAEFNAAIAEFLDLEAHSTT